MSEELQYEDADLMTFTRDMLAAGLTVEHYRTRGGWEGPAATIPAGGPDFQAVARMTAVRLQSEATGKGYTVFPRRSGKLLGQSRGGSLGREGVSMTMGDASHSVAITRPENTPKSQGGLG